MKAWCILALLYCSCLCFYFIMELMNAIHINPTKDSFNLLKPSVGGAFSGVRIQALESTEFAHLIQMPHELCISTSNTDAS